MIDLSAVIDGIVIDGMKVYMNVVYGAHVLERKELVWEVLRVC